MELAKILVACLVMVFGIFLFPTVQDECVNYVGDLEGLVHVFPLVFLVTLIVFPALFLIWEAKR